MLTYLWAVAAFALYGYLLYRGKREGMLREFAVFYAYVGATALCQLTKWVAYLWAGSGSFLYYYTFHATNSLHAAFECAVLVKLYALVRQSDVGSGITNAVRLCLVVALVVEAKHLVHEVTLSTVLVYAQLALLLHIHKHLLFGRARLGKNWGGILAGLFLLVLIKSDHFGMRLLEHLTREQWTSGLQVIEWAPWLSYLLAMRKRDASCGTSVGSQAVAGHLDSTRQVHAWARRFRPVPPMRRAPATGHRHSARFS